LLPTQVASGIFKGNYQDLQSKHLSVKVFNEIHKNPVKSDVYKNGSVRRRARIQSWASAVAIGGASHCITLHHRDDPLNT
jgi:hypothetical protein